MDFYAPILLMDKFLRSWMWYCKHRITYKPFDARFVSIPLWLEVSHGFRHSVDHLRGSDEEVVAIDYDMNVSGGWDGSPHSETADSQNLKLAKGWHNLNKHRLKQGFSQLLSDIIISPYYYYYCCGLTKMCLLKYDDWVSSSWCWGMVLGCRLSLPLLLPAKPKYVCVATLQNYIFSSDWLVGPYSATEFKINFKLGWFLCCSWISSLSTLSPGHPRHSSRHPRGQSFTYPYGCGCCGRLSLWDKMTNNKLSFGCSVTLNRS